MKSTLTVVCITCTLPWFALSFIPPALTVDVIGASGTATSSGRKCMQHSRGIRRQGACRVFTALAATSASNNKATTIQICNELEQKIDSTILAGGDPRPMIAELEAAFAGSAPANWQPNRSPEYFGEWHVWYTDYPPPSNGQLGPFQGSSGQIISSDSGDNRSYQNVLKVPPNDWLSATLDGVWEEWDGEYLAKDKADETENSANDDDDEVDEDNNVDWGATHWKVTFLDLQIKLLGIPLFRKDFPPNTSRVWRTSYLDDNDRGGLVRIVHAGQTGRSEDEYVFYTKQKAPPTA